MLTSPIICINTYKLFYLFYKKYYDSIKKEAEQNEAAHSEETAEKLGTSPDDSRLEEDSREDEAETLETPAETEGIEEPSNEAVNILEETKKENDIE